MPEKRIFASWLGNPDGFAAMVAFPSGHRDEKLLRMIMASGQSDETELELTTSDADRATASRKPAGEAWLEHQNIDEFLQPYRSIDELLNFDFGS
ncbi:hypothetical protein M8C21_023747 [Ambrosia artemisiifolia]|uniref:Uncharacterized protein n=1 Tax=Ambrosia artemisiifolia TaxID=4212 RepID=A0AAD5BZI3_AMBAR|nr:hypothetical protein M8C21_023747 [Ambrosia artemisiifolia]